MSSYSALKTRIYQQNIPKIELKTLYFNLAYINKTYTHTQSRIENSLFKFCLTITKPFAPIYLEEMKNY